MVGMKDSKTWAQAFRGYAQLKVVDDMKSLGRELRALNVILA